MGFDVSLQVSPPREGVRYGQWIQKDRIDGRLYTSAQVFRDELERIFYGGWVYVGHESEIPAPGDYVTRWVGLQPVVLVRNKSGEVRVLSNRCTHRGNLVCTQERGSAKLLTCKYHGWTFSLDGELDAVTYPAGHMRDRASLALEKPAQVSAYRGFVFATFSPRSGSLDAHLGRAKELIDRTVSMSPLGRIRLSAGWAKHRFRANWKMLAENDTDGYHAVSVHSSFLRAFKSQSQYDDIMVSEERRKSRTRDWGNGHLEIDYSPTYQGPLEWLGISEERGQQYVSAMTEAYGAERARAMLTVGPSHAYIFPNLFLGEMNIAMFQPLSPDECIQWHTALQLEGAPDHINARAIRQSEAAMGPAAFLLADDAVISEHQQIALRDRPAWLELSRGLNRERLENGVLSGNHTDETTNRAFWRHYLSVMEPQ